MYRCGRQLNTPAKRCSVCVIRTPGHSDIPSNFKSEELARLGITSQFANEFATVEIMGFVNVQNLIRTVGGHCIIGAHAIRIGLGHLVS